MSTQMIWSLLLLGFAGFLAFDLNVAWRYYRANRSNAAGGWRFLRWWAKKSKTKLAVIAGLTLVVAVALSFQGHTLALPDIWGQVRLSTKVQWALGAALAMAVFMLFDLFMTWRSCRTDTRSSRPKGFRFYWWWFRKGALKFGVVAGVGCLALGGAWAAKHYNLLQLKSETSGYMNSARQYYGEKKYREAILELKNAIRQNRNDSEANLLLAHCNIKLGNLPEARDAYREALRIDPKLAVAHLGLGKIAMAMKDPNEAIREAEQTLALAPQAPEPRLLLAAAYLATGRGDQAEGQYRAILGLAPANQEVRLNLIELLMKRRAFAEAGREAESGLKQAPGTMKLTIELAAARIGEGRRAEAVALLREAAQRDTASSVPLEALGDLYTHNKERLTALNSYMEALNRDPNNERLMNNVAAICADLGRDLALAGELASRLYAKYPNDPMVLDTMGWVLYKQGKLDQSLVLLEQAAIRAPKIAAVRFHYGMALIGSGKQDIGKRELETARKLDTAPQGGS